MKRRQTHPANGARRGVALIVVLGFLSIMILMALAFLTQARTERMVADATLEAQRGRQMVRTALAAAMNDYCVALFPPSGDRYMLPPDELKVFPSFPPTAAVDMNRTLKDDNLLLLNGEARQWIPRGYVYDNAVTNAATGAVARAEWILVREDPTDRNSRILGRYAYVCFDMSGGMDANLIALSSGVANDGDATNRASVRDVGMGKLAETANASEFKRLRSGWHGFDSLAELILLTNGKYNGGENSQALMYQGKRYDYIDEGDPGVEDVVWNPISSPRWQGDRVENGGAALISSRVTDLVPYSLTAFRGVYDIASRKWAPPLLCDAGADWDEALDPVNGQLPDKAKTILAIKDYLSTSKVPAGVDYPSVKNVPMFNEMGWNLLLTASSATSLVLQVTHNYEFWYPFPSDDNPDDANDYTLTAPVIGGGYTATPQPGSDIWMRLRIRPNKQVNLVMKGLPNPAQLGFREDYNGGSPKSMGSIVYEFDVVPATTNDSYSSVDTLQIASITMPQPIKLYMGGTAVDQMVLNIVQSLDLVNGAPPAEFSYEVDDPRLNHIIDRWTLADDAGGSPDIVNPTAEAAGYGAAGGAGKYMYCRNGPMLSPAELGYIPTGDPWETIDLCTPEGADMLSRLVADKTVRDTIVAEGTFYTNGTINPNTSSSNVLISAFAGLSMREVPNAPALPLDPLVDEDAQALAGDLVLSSTSKVIQADGGAFMSPSAWVRVPALAAGGYLAGKGLNKNQRESLIRNTWGLFSPNNSLFTALVVGQAIKEGPGAPGVWDANEDVVTGERRGVALVWRDPIPSSQGIHHEMFVRMFKFLDE